MFKTMTGKVKALAIGLVVLSMLIIPLQVALADDDLHNGICECVTYIVFSEFGKRLSGTWNDARDLANPEYWSEKHMTENKLDKGLARERSNVAKPGNIIVLQADAQYSVLVGKEWSKQTSAGYGRGHIGYVLTANYSDADQGWYITMESANWPETWGAYITSSEEAPQFHDPAGNFDFQCKNVSSKQNIFVPNGDKISFWERVK